MLLDIMGKKPEIFGYIKHMFLSVHSYWSALEEKGCIRGDITK